MSLYKRVKEAPNMSPGLLNFFKKHPSGRIWAYKDSHIKSGFVSLKKLKSLPLRELDLWQGNPSMMGGPRKTRDGGNAVLTRSICGTRILPKMFSGSSRGSVCLVGIGHKETGTWMIDVTDRVVDELNSVGSCALSKPHCRFSLISPRVKQCPYCGDKIFSKVVVEKNTVWRRR